MRGGWGLDYGVPVGLYDMFGWTDEAVDLTRTGVTDNVKMGLRDVVVAVVVGSR